MCSSELVASCPRIEFEVVLLLPWYLLLLIDLDVMILAVAGLRLEFDVLARNSGV